jgi:hypothetical protein
MQIEFKDIQPGTNLIFKRDDTDTFYGKFVWILAMLLKLFNPKWEMYGWHMGIAVWPDGTDWVVLEATWPCVKLTPLSSMGQYRAYKWLDEVPAKDKIRKFVVDHLDCKYDAYKYIWTIAAYLLRKAKINIGLWENDDYYCWELAEEFAECMNKPFTYKNITLILPEIQRCLESGCQL